MDCIIATEANLCAARPIRLQDKAGCVASTRFVDLELMVVAFVGQQSSLRAHDQSVCHIGCRINTDRRQILEIQRHGHPSVILIDDMPLVGSVPSKPTF